MITLLKRLFIENWQRKLISLILAMVIWILVNHSLTVTKTIAQVPVRVVNLPPEKTIEGMQANGILNRRVSLTVTGNRTLLEDASNKDLQIIVDALGKPDEWIAAFSKKDLESLHPDFDLVKGISKIQPVEMIIKQSKLVTEKIPILIPHPIGESPKGYQFLDVWPYQLQLSVTGPEDTVKKLKSRGLKLTFNLSNISRTELDTLRANKQEADEVSFPIPNAWKKISIPSLSDTPIEIDDPQAAALRIDFSRQDMLPIGASLPVTVFFPPKHSQTLNPDTYSLATNEFIVKKNGIKMIAAPLYAQGVSRLFLETVKDRIEVVILASPKAEQDLLIWNAQFLYPHELENRYVARVLSEASDDSGHVQPYLREDYLRNRFRKYMNSFRLYTPNHQKLALKIELQANTISVTPQNYP